jgi:hypothetical protein
MNEVIKKKIGDVSKSLKYGTLPNQTNKVKKIVDIPSYTTNGEYLIVVKNIDFCEVFLDGQTTESIKIKVLTRVSIKPINSLIDDKYDEIEIENGSCVELEYLEGGWYIISSDGMKLE